MNECLGFQMSQGIHCLWYSKFAKQLLPKIIVILIFPVFVKKNMSNSNLFLKKSAIFAEIYTKRPNSSFSLTVS